MKITKNIFILLIALFAIQPIYAQKKLNWKKHFKLAEEAFNNAEYAEAGNHYREAWRKKTKNKDLIYKAGESFFIMRDYQNAADAWQHVKYENSKYPLIGLRYARCLKQAGNYEEANNALVDFISKYEGDDRPFVTKIVQNEIRGCELAQEWAKKPENPEADIQLLSSAINTPETEFAPFPFSDEILYFSSTMAQRAEIYRSQKIDGQWIKAKVPESFPKIENGHFCNGTLTPDQKRFYFTICESVESWGGLTTRCDIYVIKRNDKTWSEPEKLRDYINMEGVTSTHPYVVHSDNTEILYFSTNREGGQGGMDIWYTTRDINSNDIDFTFPINLGSKINTPGDEITPYYNDKEQVLYFASNGQITTGGYDIFKAKGGKSQWQKVENMGTPYNSPADDFFFVKAPSGRTGFLVSNRIHGMEKITTVDEDIFELALSTQKDIFAKGGIYEQETGELMTDVTVTIYELMANGSKKLIKNQDFADGNYYFDLMPEKKYVVEAQKDGFLPNLYEFDTNDFLTYEDFGAPIYLKRSAEPTVNEPVVSTPAPVQNEPAFEKRPVNKKPSEEEKVVVTIPVTKNEPKPAEKKTSTPPVVNSETSSNTTKSANDYSASASNTVDSGLRNEKIPYKTRGKSPADRYEIITDAPRLLGTYYKIQLIAVVKFDINHSRYRPVETMGRLDTEYITKKKLTRVLLADYDTYEDAKEDLRKVKRYKNFERAFVVKYVDGERIGRIND
jgi:hypothetical protein